MSWFIEYQKTTMTASCLILFFALTSGTLLAQNVDKMEDLTPFLGHWIGTSTGFKDSKITRSEPAFEKIVMGLDGNTLEIDLYSESLRLHTIIYYSAEEYIYKYNPFYKSGSASYPAIFENGKLVVTPTPEKRFIFEIMPDGRFREYGEQKRNGVWEKYFEDIFKRVD